MPKRALILAGGGLKVGFQAGVLQVWLDEAGLKFDHADGASGGCLNLAMYCQGYSGKKIADQWRDYDPWLPVDVNLEGPGQFAHSLSYFTHDNFRRNVLTKWGIDWNAIRAGQRLGTFNLFNFSKKRLEVVDQRRAWTRIALVSAVSLPMWFPPVKINGDSYIDAVYITDANVEEAIDRGADEIWAIWTVSTRDEWRAGLRRAVLPHHRDGGRHELLHDLGADREEQRRYRRGTARASTGGRSSNTSSRKRWASTISSTSRATGWPKPSTSASRRRASGAAITASR